MKSNGQRLAIRFQGKLFRFSTWLFFIFIGVLSSPGVETMAFATPTEAMKGTIEEVLAILSDENLKKPESKKDRPALLEEAIGKRFDYTEMGKRALGRHWKKLTKSQQVEFVALFKRFLSNSYSGNVNSYAGQQVEYLGERKKGSFAEVRTKVISKKIQIPLDYRLLKTSNEWRVYDVIIDGVSLVKNFRGQFVRIIKSSSYQGLLQELQTKTSQSFIP